MKIEIKEEGDTIKVLASVTPLNGKNNVREKIRHRDIISHLSQQGVEVGTCTSSPHPPVVTNRSGNRFLTGEWIFEKPKPVSKPKPEKPVQTRKKSKKVKKTLDKSPEDVIIEVQEKTLPSKEE